MEAALLVPVLVFSFMAHVDPIGSFVVPILLFFSGTGILFGWARPVMVNPSNYRSPVWGDIRVSLAGIVANFATALVVTLLMGLVTWAGADAEPGSSAAGAYDLVYLILQYTLLLNLVLAVFNLIPIPPLDGSHVVSHMLPEGIRGAYKRAGPIAFVLLIAALYLGRFVGLDLFSILFWPVRALQDLALVFVSLWI